MLVSRSELARRQWSCCTSETTDVTNQGENQDCSKRHGNLAFMDGAEVILPKTIQLLNLPKQLRCLAWRNRGFNSIVSLRYDFLRKQIDIFSKVGFYTALRCPNEIIHTECFSFCSH